VTKKYFKSLKAVGYFAKSVSVRLAKRPFAGYLYIIYSRPIQA